MQRQSEELANSFEAPLKEAVRAVKACQAVMADRAQALQAVQSARGDQESRRAKLNKLRGIAGIKARLPGVCKSEPARADGAVHGHALWPAGGFSAVDITLPHL